MLGNLSFAYTFRVVRLTAPSYILLSLLWHTGALCFVSTWDGFLLLKVQLARIVDWVVETIVDILTSEKEAGEANWSMRSLREMQAEKAFQEMDIRVSIRKWDEKYPW